MQKDEFEMNHDDQVKLNQNEQVRNLELNQNEQVRNLELNQNEQVKNLELNQNEQVRNIELNQNEQVEMNQNEQVRDLELNQNEQVERINWLLSLIAGILLMNVSVVVVYNYTSFIPYKDPIMIETKVLNHQPKGKYNLAFLYLVSRLK